jgi:hypothetical protein
MMKRQYRLGIIGVVAILLVAVVAFTRGNPAGPEKTLALYAPAFLKSASDTSIEAPPEIAMLLSSEAGISAYFQAPDSISLSSVRSLYRTIETENAQYIIGSIPVPNYPETEDVHVYIHTDGWVLSYYLKADSTGKIFDWRNYTGGTTIPTKLENVLAIVAAQAGIPTPTITMYHFQFPNATNVMLIAEAQYGGGTDSFEINLTGSYAYYERSWSLGNNASADYVLLRLNGVEIARLNYPGSGNFSTSQGILAASQMLPDTFHTISVQTAHWGTASFGGLALVYRVP